MTARPLQLHGQDAADYIAAVLGEVFATPASCEIARAHSRAAYMIVTRVDSLEDRRELLDILLDSAQGGESQVLEEILERIVRDFLRARRDKAEARVRDLGAAKVLEGRMFGGARKSYASGGAVRGPGDFNPWLTVPPHEFMIPTARIADCRDERAPSGTAPRLPAEYGGW